MRKLLDIIGLDVCLGYDIGCAFAVTLKKTSLANDVKAQNLHSLCGVFHGYAHCRLCQLVYLARNVDGCGLEDFETCERIFSSSNKLATFTRQASVYHRKEAIDAHFRRWDMDKYANLGA